MFEIRKIFLCTALCACAAVLFSSCGKQPERETAEDGRQILYLARPADEGDTYYAGSLKSEVNRLIYEKRELRYRGKILRERRKASAGDNERQTARPALPKRGVQLGKLRAAVRKGSAR